jgi:hypothetical protein
MNYVIAVFRSRAETIRFNNELKAMGVLREIVSTPRQARVGCGLSVKFKRVNSAHALKLLRFNGYNTFAGFYEVTANGVKRVNLP